MLRFYLLIHFIFQPAVTTQTFGHKYGGFIYAFLFSSDLVNNLMVATLSKVSFHILFYNLYVYFFLSI